MRKLLAGGQFDELRKRLAAEYLATPGRSAARKIAEREGVSSASITIWAKRYFPDAAADKLKAMPKKPSVQSEKIQLLDKKLDELSAKLDALITWLKS